MLQGRTGCSSEGMGAPGRERCSWEEGLGALGLARAVPVQLPLIRLCKWPRSRGEHSEHGK